MSIFIYGSGDDRIEVEGDLYEEFNITDDVAVIGFENGLVARLSYDGDWNIRVLDDAPGKVDFLVHSANTRAAKAIAENDYSDVLEIKTPAKWAVCGVDYVTSK